MTLLNLIKVVFKSTSRKLSLEYNNFAGKYRNFNYDKMFQHITFNDCVEIYNNYDNKLLCRIDKNNILNVREI